MERGKEERHTSHSGLKWEENRTTYESGHDHRIFPICKMCARVRRLLISLGRGFTEIAVDDKGNVHRHKIINGEASDIQ